VDLVEARRCGQTAVTFAARDQNGSVAMKRLSEGGKYSCDYFRTDLKNVAEKTKSMPDEFISAGGNDVTKAFVEYAARWPDRCPGPAGSGAKPASDAAGCVILQGSDHIPAFFFGFPLAGSHTRLACLRRFALPWTCSGSIDHPLSCPAFIQKRRSHG